MMRDHNAALRVRRDAQCVQTPALVSAEVKQITVAVSDALYVGLAPVGVAPTMCGDGHETSKL